MRRRLVKGDSGPVVEASGDGPVEQSAGDSESRRLRPGVQWANVVSDTLRIDDPSTVARRLREELSLGNDRVSYGIVIAALDKSAANYELAGRLYRAARTEEKRFEHECTDRLSTLREAALKELMGEYAAKVRKSPTKDDVESRMFENWPDEYASIQNRLNELHNATQSLEVLRDAWASRCADLRIMANRTAYNGERD